jgi:hypothetical protein
LIGVKATPKPMFNRFHFILIAGELGPLETPQFQRNHEKQVTAHGKYRGEMNVALNFRPSSACWQ